MSVLEHDDSFAQEYILIGRSMFNVALPRTYQRVTTTMIVKCYVVLFNE